MSRAIFFAAAVAIAWMSAARADTFAQLRGSTLNASDFVGLETMRLWPHAAPAAQGDSPDDIPTLTVFRPRNANGTAVIVAPGGGYQVLMASYEGREIADWLTARGVTAFVLKYRLGPRYTLPVPLLDAQRAIRLLRAEADRLNISANRIGVMGFSAGGHLAALTGTLFDAPSASAPDPVDRQSDRPDFLVLAYPAIEKHFVPDRDGKVGYCVSLRIEKCDVHALEKYLPARHVSADTPPAFLYHTGNDESVAYDDPIAFYRALRAAGVPAEMHLFEHGTHGSGLGGGDAALDQWPLLLEGWLRARGLLTPDPALGAGKELPRTSADTPGIDTSVGRLLAAPATRAILKNELGPGWIEDIERHAPPGSLDTFSLRQCAEVLHNIDNRQLRSLAMALARVASRPDGP